MLYLKAQMHKMTIEQTVEIPAGHRLIIEVPPEIPAGRAILAFTPAGETRPRRRRPNGRERPSKNAGVLPKAFYPETNRL
jgi:hypothetical protein